MRCRDESTFVGDVARRRVRWIRALLGACKAWGVVAVNLPRLRELLKAWQDGSIREAELLELRDALPEVLDLALTGENFIEALKKLRECDAKVPIIPHRYPSL